MSAIEPTRGVAVVMQPDQGQSYWQPVPANGHADPKLVPGDTGYRGASLGFQTVAPHSRVREHSHGEQIEMVVCFRGRGYASVDGVRHELMPGTACFMGADVKHEFINESDEELVILWVISPAGLEDFFRTIGRPRHADEAAPAPFPRPTDVVALERSMGMDNTVAAG
ncbi:MAG: cupin domain-containing protein [Rhodospirillales bacterium]